MCVLNNTVFGTQCSNVAHLDKEAHGGTFSLFQILHDFSKSFSLEMPFLNFPRSQLLASTAKLIGLHRLIFDDFQEPGLGTVLLGHGP